MVIPFLIVIAANTPDQSLARFVYPLSKPIDCPPVVIDITDFPEGKVWAETAKAVVETWFSKLTELLATEGKDPLTNEDKGNRYKPPTEVRLVFKKKIDVPAYASGGTITVNGEWITAHPEDIGMIVHELTHVIQQYPNSRNKPGWLVEGIADYIRWWRYEPELHAGPGRTKVNAEKAKYTDSYRTTAVWLAWCSRKYDMRLVPALDKAMRDREDPMPIFQKLTTKTPEELWEEFKATLK